MSSSASSRVKSRNSELFFENVSLAIAAIRASRTERAEFLPRIVLLVPSKASKTCLSLVLTSSCQRFHPAVLQSTWLSTSGDTKNLNSTIFSLPETFSTKPAVAKGTPSHSLFLGHGSFPAIFSTQRTPTLCSGHKLLITSNVRRSSTEKVATLHPPEPCTTRIDRNVSRYCRPSPSDSHHALRVSSLVSSSNTGSNALT